MTRLLEVVGRGSLKAEPDMMRFNYELVQDAPSYGEAFDKLSKQFDALVKVFKTVGFNVSLIQTSSINVSIIHETDVQKKKFRGNQSLIFEDRINLAKMSKLLDGLRSEDDFNFSLSYFIKDATKYTNDALILAINDAHDKSKVIAESAGVRLGSITNIVYESDSQNYPTLMRAYAYDTGGSDIHATNITIEQSVTMSWEIK